MSLRAKDFRRAKMVLFCLHSCEQLIHQKIDRWRLVSFRTSKHARSGFNKRSCFGTRASLYRDGHRLDLLLAFINLIILFAPYLFGFARHLEINEAKMFRLPH